MQIPLEVRFRNMSPSEALKTNISEKADKLEQLFDRIIACRVMVEAGHKHHKKGNLFHVRIDLTIPGHEIIVNKEPSQHHSYTDVYVAVRDAFDNMQQQLEHYVERKRGDVKTHEAPSHGRILELNPDEGFGRIETPDGRNIYFHRNSLINTDFDKLKVGTEVRFDEEQGNLGPQASTVKIIGKHHIVE